LVEISSENNSVTIFPIPIELFKPFLGSIGSNAQSQNKSA